MDLNLKLALNVIPWLKVPVALTQPHCFKVTPNLNGVFRAGCRVLLFASPKMEFFRWWHFSWPWCISILRYAYASNLLPMNGNHESLVKVNNNKKKKKWIPWITYQNINYRKRMNSMNHLGINCMVLPLTCFLVWLSRSSLSSEVHTHGILNLLFMLIKYNIYFP